MLRLRALDLEVRPRERTGVGCVEEVRLCFTTTKGVCGSMRRNLDMAERQVSIVGGGGCCEERDGIAIGASFSMCVLSGGRAAHTQAPRVGTSCSCHLGLQK